MKLDKYKYRFKTEQELYDDLGNSWRTLTNMNSDSMMDYLLGKEININELNKNNTEKIILDENGNIKYSFFL